MTQTPEADGNEPGVDMTELMEAIAKLNGEEPPSSPVIVPAAIVSPISAQVGKKEAETRAALKIGEKDTDGWIYAGVSPQTKKQMFAAPTDGVMSYYDAAKAAKTLQEQGKAETRLPSLGELRVMFNSKAEIGGFAEAGPNRLYWAPMQYYVWDYKTRTYNTRTSIKSFSNGTVTSGPKSDTFWGKKHSVRLVRS